MKSLCKSFLVFALALWGANAVHAQASLKKDEAKKEAEVKKIVSSGRYTFEATKEVSKNGSMPLKQRSDLDITKDTLIAFLPGLGKSSAASASASASGITCNRFKYDLEHGKHGRTEVIIKPEQKSAADKDVKELKLNISPSGYGTLTVIRTDKKPVSYYGYIRQEIADFPQASSRRL
jgi:hypothetical protein